MEKSICRKYYRDKNNGKLYYTAEKRWTNLAKRTFGKICADVYRAHFRGVFLCGSHNKKAYSPCSVCACGCCFGAVLLFAAVDFRTNRFCLGVLDCELRNHITNNSLYSGNFQKQTCNHHFDNNLNRLVHISLRCAATRRFCFANRLFGSVLDTWNDYVCVKKNSVVQIKGWKAEIYKLENQD